MESKRRFLFKSFPQTLSLTPQRTHHNTTENSHYSPNAISNDAELEVSKMTSSHISINFDWSAHLEKSILSKHTLWQSKSKREWQLVTHRPQLESPGEHLPSPPELQLPEDRLRGREGGWDAGGVGGPLRPMVPPLPRSRRTGGGGGRFWEDTNYLLTKISNKKSKTLKWLKLVWKKYTLIFVQNQTLLCLWP